MSRARTGLLLTVVCAPLVLLVGCPQPQPRPSPPPPTPAAASVEPPASAPVAPFKHQPVGDADRAVAYYGYLSTLSAEQLTREYERTLRFYREQYSDLTFMQVVLLRIMPNAPFRDSAQARDMLSSFLKEPRVRSSELQPLALLLHTMLTEQQQKDAEIQAQAQRLKEETKRYDAVKQKLDALIDAERKMLERNKPVRSQ
jgi:hypothetical protein